MPRSADKRRRKREARLPREVPACQRAWMPGSFLRGGCQHGATDEKLRLGAALLSDDEGAAAGHCRRVEARASLRLRFALALVNTLKLIFGT